MLVLVFSNDKKLVAVWSCKDQRHMKISGADTPSKDDVNLHHTVWCVANLTTFSVDLAISDPLSDFISKKRPALKSALPAFFQCPHTRGCKAVDLFFNSSFDFMHHLSKLLHCILFDADAQDPKHIRYLYLHQPQQRVQRKVHIST